jgi:hypothetical protein
MHVAIFHWKVIAGDRKGHRIYLDGRVGNNFSTEGDNFCWSSRPKLYKFPMKWQQKRVLSIGWNAQIYSSEHSGGVRNIELSTHRSYHMNIMWHFTLNPSEIVEALRLKIMRPFASQFPNLCLIIVLP